MEGKVMRNKSQSVKTNQIVLRKVLLLAQIFGYMPLQNVIQPDPSNLQFSWISWKMLYSLFTMVGILFMICMQFINNFVVKSEMGAILFYVVTVHALLSSILFISLARRWPKFMKCWHGIEVYTSKKYGWPPEINKNVKMVLIIFCGLGLAQYIVIINHEYVDAATCANGIWSSITLNYFLKYKMFSYVYLSFAYNVSSGIILLFVHVQICFADIFIDVFVMIMSLTLAHELKQYTKRVEYVAACKITSQNTWKKLREDYDQFSHLCKIFDSNISSFIVLSFAKNLILIVFQLFNSLKVQKNVYERLDLCYALIFLFIRTFWVCVYGSKVYDEGRRPLSFLYGVPASVYNNEVERLIHQISTDDMALTGLNFFYIKRDVVLKIGGVLVSYELMLIEIGNFLRESVLNRNGTYNNEITKN